MTILNRRIFMGAAASTLALGGCANGIGGGGAPRLDARVDATRDFLFGRYPGTRELAAKSQGVLFMPLITEAGFGIGAAYGQGALRINDVTVDYYSTTRATIGFQIGAQQYAHALFFLTESALGDFRRASGWAAGADIRYATPDQGASIGKDTTEIDPVVALIFGQSGLIAGATLAGTKYTRILP
ncbi:Las17-binding protein actin regulator [Pseudorhodobacter antarcticus]|jgi:lipid-binding SYLF domain-containing protein|uniref:Las17-binding protein actin regulator n=1 Tax=Pseudorhodobacter antarcticus TaxID=1077947 RepID=A0A1H8J5T6_9RHOB|nr:YSC84-related protein [Pseudorhodobacter antarcticus]SEN75961.1 Las17-binding protein actin regulator [Pseudorhodobacter antarcticus]